MPSTKKNASNIHATLRKRLPLLLPLLVGMVLVYLGFIIRGLDLGSCPTLGFNGVTAPCFHNFAGTDIPITTAGNMVIIIGTVLVVTTAAFALYTQSLHKEAK
jgi:hypothetical protein